MEITEIDFKNPNFVRLFVKGLETKEFKIFVDFFNNQFYIIYNYLNKYGWKITDCIRLKKGVVEKNGIVLEDMNGGKLKVYDLLEYNDEWKFWRSNDKIGGSLLYYEDGRWELEEPGERLKRKVG